jgi:DNA-cytosine methyltransferase
MNILSLFDGMSCGQQALNRLGINYDNYYASELDKYAIQVTQKNFPDTIQLGDVCGVVAKDLPKDIDLLLAGSPCQGFSFAGKQLAFDDPRSALFFEFVRLLRELKPNYFLLENVRMKKEYLDVITEQVSSCYTSDEVADEFKDMFGNVRFEPILINSALVSAQNRQRYYWTNIPDVTQPEDKGLVLSDVLEDGYVSERDKSYCLDANYFKGTNLKGYLTKKRRQLVSKPKQVGTAVDIKGYDIIKRVYSPDGKSPALTTMQGGNTQPKVVTGAWRGRYKIDGVRQDGKGSVAGRTKQMLELRKDDKTNALTTVQKDNVVVEPEQMNWRKLTPLECERLQTVEDNYTEGVSNTQRFKMLGNGMTVEIISHILSNVNPDRTDKNVDF